MCACVCVRGGGGGGGGGGGDLVSASAVPHRLKTCKWNGGEIMMTAKVE